MPKKEQDIDRLIQLLQGRLSGQKKRQLEAEIEADPSLAAIFASLKQLLRTGKDLRRSGLALATRGLAKQLFEDFRDGRKRPGSPVGIRVFDTRHVPLPEGVRPATVDTRRLRWRLPEGELEAAVYPVTDSAFELIGQLSGIREEGVVTAQVLTSSGTLSAEADEFGLFRFERIPGDSRELRIRSDSGLIGIVTLDL